MKRVIAFATAFGLAVAISFTAGAANNNAQQRLKTFFGDKGDVTWQTGPDDNPQPVDDSPLDGNQSRLKLNVPEQTSDDYTGVYALGTGLSGKAVGAVKNLSFDYLSPAAGGFAGDSGPRYSIPIDENGDDVWDKFVYMSAGPSNCPGLSIGGNWLRSDFTGRTATGCTIWYGSPAPTGVPYSSDGTHSAWQNFALANPSFHVTTQSSQVAFVILDEVGTSFIDRVAFQNHMFGGGPNQITNCPTENSC